jgi:transposase
MSSKKNTYDSRFRSKVALEAAKEEKTLAQLSSEYKVHANLISKWKKELLTKLPLLFEESKNKELLKIKKEREELLKQIGTLVIEKEYLKKN